MGASVVDKNTPENSKSRSNSISIPHLDPSAFTQVTPSINATVASAAKAGAPNSSASHGSSETDLPPIEPFVPTETTNTKVEVDSFDFTRKHRRGETDG